MVEPKGPSKAKQRPKGPSFGAKAPSPSEDPDVVPQESPGYAIKRTQPALRLHMDRQLKRFGMTAPQYNARLARWAFVTPQTMPSMRVKLERAGLIERSPDADHGRIQRTQLTNVGPDTLLKAHRSVRETGDIARNAASPDAAKMLLRVAKALS